MPNAPRSPVPHAWPTVTPRLVASGARELVEFLQRVFGATGAFESERPTVLQLGDSRLMISEAGERAATTGFLYVYVADADATWRRAVAAGARTIEEPIETPYGDRRAMVVDRWGNTWQIATPPAARG